ncbi:hypothetical protein H5410_041431, partial [Solanum commersonii]
MNPIFRGRKLSQTEHRASIFGDFLGCDKLLVAGRLQEELIIKYLDNLGVCLCSSPTYNDYSIATAIEINNTTSGALHFITSNNDS